MRGNSENFDGKIDILNFTCLTKEVWLIQEANSRGVANSGNWKDECKRQNMDIAHGGTDKSHEQVIDICVFGLVIDYHCCH